MKFTLPLYHEKFTENGAVRYFVRPLFHETPDACREDLRRATDSVANALRRDLAALARKPRQDDLAAMVFSPELNEQTARVSIALRRRTFEAEYLLVSWEAMGRRLCMTPRLPGLWFALERGQDAASRAGEVLSAYYRSLERQGLDTDPTLHAPRGSAWITHQELDIALDHSLPDERAEGRAAIGAYESLPGDEELHRVGRLVNALYPEALVRAVQRDAEVADLTRLLAAADRRPLLLLGPSGAGKTAVLHEHVRRTMEPGQRRSAPQQVWQVAPQRLISGMSYVGQWENRLHAILAEVRRRDHVLYFDDFLGLFRAGQSAGSRLSVAQVLRPFAERREVRVLAEMTPQAFRVLAEQDRGWSDLFHVIPVREQPEEEALRVVLHGRRNLESSHECRLDVEAVATAVELQQRYRRDTAMPGKALGFLGQVAARHRGEAVSRDDVLREFEAQSGLSVTFLDQRRKLERDEVLAGLRRGVLGQEAALQAVADAIVVARARLNDPERPLGSFLFLGPTGTGKTHCAKALARWLYGCEEALLRFDLNEFQSPHSVARLAGSFDEPEGLLTSAVRRRPFSVLLFDEVEKAHPAAHDLLLQVLGEGRLTDALGRTADFCNTMIVLTSNLGAEQAHQAMGFGRHAEPGAEAYVAAARKFFRPEFFNRLDRIVPFARLPREQVGEIARGLLAGLLRREGLVRRLCILHVDDGALQRVVDEGFHPQLGARAVRRALEQAFTVPLARHLAALRADVPTVIRLSGDARAVNVAVQPLAPAMAVAPAAAALDYSDPHGVIAAVDAVVDHARDWLEQRRPEGAVSQRDLNRTQRRYFSLRRQADWLADATDRLAERLEQDSRERPDPEGGVAARTRRLPRSTPEVTWDRVAPDAWLSLRGEADLRAAAASSLSGEDARAWEAEDRLRRLAGAAAWLARQLAHDGSQGRALLLVQPLAGEPLGLDSLVEALQSLLRRGFELRVSVLRSDARTGTLLQVDGELAAVAASLEQGVHLLAGETGLCPVQVAVVPSAQATPPEPGPVVRVWYPGRRVLDLRSGILTRRAPEPAHLQMFAQGALPLEAAP